MASLSREQILAADDLRRVKMEVPEWGGVVFVSTMTAADRGAFEAANEGASAQAIRERAVAATVTDASGARLFTDDDVEALGAKSAKVLERLALAAFRLNGITDGDVEELVKNSPTDPSGDSSTG